MKWLGVLYVLSVLMTPSLALDREAFTFTNYDLDVRIEPEQQRLGVRGKITLRNDSLVPRKVLRCKCLPHWIGARFRSAGNPWSSSPTNTLRTSITPAHCLKPS